MTLARIWTVRFDPGQSEDYARFIREQSLPMFKQQPGYRGVLFLGSGEERTVVTLWDTAAHIDALKHSPSYTTTVAAILNAKFIRGEATITVHDVELSDFA